MIQQSHSWLYMQKRQKSLIQKDACNPVFIAALLQQLRHRNNPSAHLQMLILNFNKSLSIAFLAINMHFKYIQQIIIFYYVF